MIPRSVAAALEHGLPRWRLLEAAERAYMYFAHVERPLRLPAGVRVVTVGGATLGGSGKTPLAVAIARLIASHGANIALVSHAHAASGAAPTWLSGSADPKVFGDEATASAEALADTGARVVSAKRRQDAVDFAARWADVLVLDGPVQLTPVRAHLSVLALDARRPWGSGACPPRGDLRAPVRTLTLATDRLARISSGTAAAEGDGEDAIWRLHGARCTATNRQFHLAELRAMRLGLVTNVARPARVRRTLEARGLVIDRHVALADHAQKSISPAITDAPHIDLWLAPRKLRQAREAPKTAWIDAHLELSPAFAMSVMAALGGPCRALP